MMTFKDGARVVTASDETVGHIERVVLDPRTHEVTHLVIRQGFLFTEDTLLPLRLVHSATEEEVRLQAGVDDLDHLPRYETTHFVPVHQAEIMSMGYPVTGYAPPIYGYPPFGAVWGRGDHPDYIQTPDGDYLATDQPHIPDDTVALQEGARVMSADDRHVGEVESVLVNGDRATHFIISQGLLLKDRKLVPLSWVTNLLSEEVWLSVSAATLELLPEYQPS